MQARSKIAKRGEQIGLDFDGEVEALRGAADWDAELASIRDPSLQLPAYYTQPFHAYPEGNLCWEAALQVLRPSHPVSLQNKSTCDSTSLPLGGCLIFVRRVFCACDDHEQ